MSLYNHRTPGPDGVQALLTLEDLERYCYFVAGTVGHMLTELFLCEVEVADEQRRVLKKNAEAFGLGLQLVNILKDVTDDRERQVSFIPRTLADEAGLTIRSLTSPENRGAAHRAVAPIFDVARERLDRALDYCLALPSSEPGVRLFCLLPLWMAARTLVLAQGNDHMFIAGEPVKISRPEVEQIIADCVAHADDDAYLRARYAQLWEPDAAAAKGSTAGGSRELN
jgi:farnesyl-diphosphate farnesyltransferase